MTNWKNCHDYEYAKGLPADGWAWEFLRRTNRYRTTYDKYQIEMAALSQEVGVDWPGPSKHTVYVPPKLMGESREAWMMRVTITNSFTDPREIPMDQFWGQKFDLEKLYSPHDRYSSAIKFLPLQSGLLFASTMDDLDLLVSREAREADTNAFNFHQCVFAFNLSVSTHRQLREATKILKRERKRRGTEIQKKALAAQMDYTWALYLRTLDAASEGASIEDIASILFPKPGKDQVAEQMAKATLEQATNTCERYDELRRVRRKKTVA